MKPKPPHERITERITASIPAAFAAYLRRQAARELRTISGMLVFMIEFYRREHPDD